jgi:zinc protease
MCWRAGGILLALGVVQVVPVPGTWGGDLGAQEAPPEPEPVDVHVEYTQFTLENGLTFIVHRDRSLPIASVNVWYHVGSANERPGRTGFAHLFEHVMFEGSANVAEGDFDNLLEAAGGQNNGSTTNDRTNYYEDVPSNAVELALWLEADRMGFLLETMSESKLDLQRDVVKNERRQSYENRPYGQASLEISSALYPAEHPYSWPVIGSQEDLSAAAVEDVSDFFRTYYAPNNASIAVAGNVRVREIREWAEKYFGEIPRGPEVPVIDAPDPSLSEEVRLVLEDDVQLPRLYMAWHSPAAFADGDAELQLGASLLASGRTSRLQQRLIYEEQVAQNVFAFQSGRRLGGAFQIIATARPGVDLDVLEAAIREELAAMATDGVEERDLDRVVRGVETGFVRSLERVGSFGGKANSLNRYYFFTGDPGFVRKDLARFTSATPGGVQESVAASLVDAPGVVLSVVPEGRMELAAGEGR